MHNLVNRQKIMKTIDPIRETESIVEDNISLLLDEILTCILSFLPTKEAVRTCILSKRWKSLWTFVPTLSIDDCYLDKKPSSFVDRVLIGHEMPFLEEIDITWAGYDKSRLDSWVSAAVEGNVRVLKFISLNYEKITYTLPSCLFTMNKIVTLHVELCAVRFPSVLPCFPKLKKLMLCFLAYENDDTIRNLISCCPVLEELVLSRIRFDDGLKTVIVRSRSLKRLSLINSTYTDEEPGYAPTITIDCPAVEYIHIDDTATKTFVVKRLSSVVSLKLDLANIRFGSRVLGPSASHILELLVKFSYVKDLSISESTLSMLAMSASDGDILPPFPNLKSLEFFTLKKHRWNMAEIIEFLRCTPVLEVLVIQGSSFSTDQFSGDKEIVPNCLTSHLKTIEFDVYSGENDVDVIDYFLRNSKVLENVSVKRKGEEEFKWLRRSSKSCRISFSKNKVVKL